jgi:hypothetical protein
LEVGKESNGDGKTLVTARRSGQGSNPAPRCRVFEVGETQKI